MADRKAASVLPDPVGAATSVWRPARIAGQASSWAAVGLGNAEENHAATAGWKSSCTPRILRARRGPGAPPQRRPHRPEQNDEREDREPHGDRPRHERG